MNQAFATFSILNSTRAVVDIQYRFTDGRKSYDGFSTVEVDLPTKLYDACYQRADALAEQQNCRLEKFSQAENPYRIHFYNFGYFYAVSFKTLEEAKQTAEDKGFDCNIYKHDTLICSWSIISGFRTYD